MADMRSIAITGGPCGGKSVLLERVKKHRKLKKCSIILEEAIHQMRFVRMNPRTREFQCALVAIQSATESNIINALSGTERRLLISHRGTLDPCAFWQSFGNSRESFFEMTGTTIEDHYKRYDLVIHLETSAVRVPEHYIRYPYSHRPEDIEQAILLDNLLGELWCGHPNYVKINGTKDIEEKLNKGLKLICDMI
jgi:hypothetical protein